MQVRYKQNVAGDALRINQILINILSNAVKYTPEGGRVDFEAEEIPAADGEVWTADKKHFAGKIRKEEPVC